MARYLLRVGLFSLLFLISMAAAGSYTLLLVAAYSLVYAGPEVILIGLAIDAYYGFGSGMWYHYTVLCGLIALAAVVLRPYLSVYNRR